MSTTEDKIVYTIGHGTRSLEHFIAILESFAIEQLVDIRTIPRSRHNPQFNFDTFPTALRNKRIGYRHEKDLGGLRKPQKDSINQAWQNPGFRGFADHMQSETFALALGDLLDIARTKTLVIMCAESVPWRCHRSLIADAMLVRGVDVFDIFDLNRCRGHALTPWATIRGTSVTYP